jgi:hypothetical protein
LLVETPLGAKRCLSIPVSDGRKVEWEPGQHFTLGLAFSIEALTTQVAAVDRVVTLPLEVGAWLGRYQVHAGAGIGGSGCPEPNCPTSKDSKINYSNAFPFFAGVRRSVYDSGELSFGVAVRYRAIHLAADTFEGRKTSWMHGPIIAPYFGAATPVRTDGSGIGGARESLIALEVPVGYDVATNGEHTLTIGMNLAMYFSAF